MRRNMHYFNILYERIFYLMLLFFIVSHSYAEIKVDIQERLFFTINQSNSTNVIFGNNISISINGNESFKIASIEICSASVENGIFPCLS